MRNTKILILTLAVAAAVLAVAGLGMTDETAGGGAAMSNTSSVAPAPLGTYSTPPAQ